MIHSPHKLFRVERQPTQVDDNGNIVANQKLSEVYLCNCFLHDASTHMQQGYAGQGINVTYYVNMNRRTDLEINHEILVTESDGGTIRGKGKILDIKHTSGMHFAGQSECTTIFI
jgi:hypothetical protein